MIYTSGDITNGTIRYRIEVRQLQDGSWQQRHIWYAGSVVGDYTLPENCEEHWQTTSASIGAAFASRHSRYGSGSK